MSDIDANPEAFKALEAAYQITDAEELTLARLVIGEAIDLVNLALALPSEREIVSVREFKDKFLEVRGKLSFVFGQETTEK